MLERWFLAHPKSVGESYFEHQRMALGFAAALLKAGFACLIHGFVPGLFQSTGSRTVAALHERMTTNRMRNRPALEAGSLAMSGNAIETAPISAERAMRP
jgi:hypothetical protein